MVMKKSGMVFPNSIPGPLGNPTVTEFREGSDAQASR
jgi:hypothetical protein